MASVVELPQARHSPDSPGTSQSPDESSGLERIESNVSTYTAASDVTQNGPAAKTDKPRPHVCATCARSFARLEHLKRHERSHTKEKPFECPECARCFARRDLLLRHQQKLHMTTAPQTKPKAQRRESTTALGPAAGSKIRKNSHAAQGQTSGSMRPRANTISHVDGGSLGMFAGADAQAMNAPDSRHPSLVPGRFPPSFDYRNVPAQNGHHVNVNLLPRIATDMHMDPHAALRTAPPGGTFGADFDQLFTSAGSTINPAQLHMGESGMGDAQSPFHNPFGTLHSVPIMEDDDNFDWMKGFSNHMAFGGPHDHAIAGSSPSAMSTGSPGGFAGGEQHFDQNQLQQNPVMWQQQQQQQQHNFSQTTTQHPFGYDTTGQGLHEFALSPDALSPANLQHHIHQTDQMFHAHPGALSSPPMAGMHSHLGKPMQFGSDGTSASTASLASGRTSSMTSVSTDSITDVTRHALLVSLSQPSGFGHSHRSYTQPMVSSPLSPRDMSSGGTASSSSGKAPTSLPSTFDLQRYVSAYIQYFHPHTPFLHIPTLSFDSPAYTSHLRAANSGSGFGQGGIVGGGGCLILAMSAIGALYESDLVASKELFNASKKMIQLYLEERRGQQNQQKSAGDLVAQNTPLWLVQAMLLNVIYGHQCGDKVANDIASTHCIALVSLARAAELVKPLSEVRMAGDDVTMSDDFGLDENAQWHKWIAAEERKRTLFVIFHMSSLLVSAYNHAPALMNSEIQLNLPCDEDLWTAENAAVWSAKGGNAAAEANSILFSSALSELLSASQRANDHQDARRPSSEMKISTFGCLVLINALHNYIWETRQRHCGRRWTAHETEVMHAHIEPALRAWQSAWASNPLHSLERPNPYGMGPLSADSIPLLDLAYVRLFVNLGKAKDLLWQREYDAMAEELARGTEIVLHADASEATTGQNSTNGSRNSPEPGMDIKIPRTPGDDMTGLGDAHSRPQSSKRERHLRKAALYAADSLEMSEKLGVTYADFTSRELPVQSAICATDCAQVLAEWVATVQDRVGRHLGILGRDNVDFSQVPAIILLEDEDCRLLEKIAEIVRKAESKMTFDAGDLANSPALIAFNQKFPSGAGPYGSKILLITAYMLDRGAVWPVQSILSRALVVQSTHMDRRAELSVQETS